MAHGSYRHWLATALVSLALMAALTAVIPMKHARERATDARAGSAFVTAQEMTSPGRSFTQPPNPLSGAVASVAAALQSVPKAFFPLLLILLLLLLAVIIIWGFRRSRAAQWLLRQIAWFLGLIPRAWRLVRSWLRRLPRLSTQTPTTAEAGPPADPLLDPFEHPETLAGLTAREIVIRTYHLLLNFAEMLGHGRNRGQTPFEYANVLSRSAPDARESVLALTWAYAGAMYGGENAPIPDPDATRDFWRSVSASLTSGLTEDDLDLRRRAYLAALAVQHERRTPG